MFRRLPALSLAVLVAAPSLARADAASCTQTLGEAIRTYGTARQKAIAGCESKRSSGTLAASTVCRPQCSYRRRRSSTSTTARAP